MRVGGGFDEEGGYDPAVSVGEDYGTGADEGVSGGCDAVAGGEGYVGEALAAFEDLGHAALEVGEFEEASCDIPGYNASGVFLFCTE